MKLLQTILSPSGSWRDLSGGVDPVGTGLVLAFGLRAALGRAGTTDAARSRFPGARHPCIIALTANVFLEHRADAAQSGMQGSIAKPLRAEALTEAHRNAHAWLLEHPAPKK